MSNKIDIYMDNTHQKYDLNAFGKNVVSFGRSSDCDIQIRKEYVSRVHGCFYMENGKWFIKDMNSTNGLYYISNEYYLRMLYKKYEVYNLSKKNLSSSEALLLIKAFLKVDSFNACVLSLGEGDYALNKTKEEFKRNLMEIVSICNYYGVKIILQDPLDKKALKTYSEVIEEVRGYYHLDIINYHKVLPFGTSF